MALPKLNKPIFEIEIPSMKKKVTYNPFTVKEEKILLIAQESKEPDQMVLAIKQILNNCIHDIDIDKLATFDLEFLLINLRAKSVNNIFEVNIKDPDTEETVKLEVDIDDIKVYFDPEHKNKIELEPDVYLIMRYPSLKQLDNIIKLATSNTTSSELFELMISCFDILAHGEDIYKFDEYTPQEKIEFTDDLSSSAINEIKNFFKTIPALQYETSYKNSNGDTKKFILKGTETFFI
jgi:hypothetical protein